MLLQGSMILFVNLHALVILKMISTVEIEQQLGYCTLSHEWNHQPSRKAMVFIDKEETGTANP